LTQLSHITRANTADPADNAGTGSLHFSSSLNRSSASSTSTAVLRLVHSAEQALHAIAAETWCARRPPVRRTAYALCAVLVLDVRLEPALVSNTRHPRRTSRASRVLPASHLRRADVPHAYRLCRAANALAGCVNRVVPCLRTFRRRPISVGAPHSAYPQCRVSWPETSYHQRAGVVYRLQKPHDWCLARPAYVPAPPTSVGAPAPNRFAHPRQRRSEAALVSTPIPLVRIHDQTPAQMSKHHPALNRWGSKLRGWHTPQEIHGIALRPVSRGRARVR
jgi:hypothetical protein